MDYFRFPSELWRDRLLKARRGGLNCIASCIVWNFHETEEGRFNFSGDRDLGHFIDLCGELGLYFYARVRPFICDEWDGGGHPAWLIAKDDSATLMGVAGSDQKPCLVFHGVAGHQGRASVNGKVIDFGFGEKEPDWRTISRARIAGLSNGLADRGWFADGRLVIGPAYVVPESRWQDGSQWHVLTCIGTAWAKRDTRYSAEQWADWAAKVAAKGGVITLDMGPNCDPNTGPVGSLAEAQLNQVQAIKAALEKR